MNRHRRTDPACMNHRPPRTRLGTWWYDHNRGRSCPTCMPWNVGMATVDTYRRIATQQAHKRLMALNLDPDTLDALAGLVRAGYPAWQLRALGTMRTPRGGGDG